MKHTLRLMTRGTALSAALALAGLLQAQENTPAATDAAADPNKKSNDVLLLDSFVVTATSAPGKTTKMDSSISISTVQLDTLEITAPRATSELFRNLPSIRAESSSGEGNTNIAVRGLPITTGGAKYVQLQEDGVPVLLFGDIAFATADQFVRSDFTVATLESVRGGSASTFTTNAPGGVINFLSKSGDVAGGELGLTHGLGYDLSRVDLAYGGALSNDTTFAIGGFYRTGEGAKTAGYNANNGGQFKASLTRKFANGSIKLYVKVLDDRTLSFLPVPMAISGSDSSPTYGSLPGFDALKGTSNTPYLTSLVDTKAPGQVLHRNAEDGIHSISKAVGGDISFNLPGDWRLNDNFRVSANSGDFIDPYVASVMTGSDYATGLAGAHATLTYANGPSAGQAFNNPNGLVSVIHMFDVELNDFGNVFNDVKLSKQFQLGDTAKLDVSAGLFTASQRINMDWNWDSYLEEVKGKNAALVDVTSAGGIKQTEGGLISYGTSVGPGNWGNTHQNYDLTYTTEAPHASLGLKVEKLLIDASVREDFATARGTHAGGTAGAYDINGDGKISVPEQTVNFIDYASATPINYNTSFISYSVGANYLFTRNVSVFARYSRGGSEDGSRAVGSSLITSSGGAASHDATIAEAKQTEVGFKWRVKDVVPGQLEFFLTAFQATAAEVANDPTRVSKGLSPIFSNDYKSTGFDLEGGYAYGGLTVRLNATQQDSKIDYSSTAGNVGHRPQRTPDLMFTLTPSYRFGRVTVGGSFVEVSQSYAGDDNTLVQPAYNYTNLFAGYELAKGLTLSLSVNNVFNQIGITEVDSGRETGLNGQQVIQARSITGRTVSATLKYAF
ncbi:MAG: TonB-dependent receptor domain-containing protein [Opitutales bacterium]